LRLAHFAAGEGKLAMLHSAQTGYMTVNRNVIGRVGEYDVSPLRTQESRIVLRASSVAADQLVTTEEPDIAAGGHHRIADLRNMILGGVSAVRIALLHVIEDEVGLREAETREFDIEFQVDEALQLDGQDLAIPAGIQGQFVVGKNVRSSFGIG
jgi:hypothetical protein